MAYRTIGFNLDDGTYQRAVSHAVRQGKTINRVVAELIAAYAGEPASPPDVAGSPTAAPATPPVSGPETTPPTPVSSPAEPTAPPDGAPSATVRSIYVVQSGDTLGLIAKKMYGSPNKYFIIQKANNITDPRRIWVGQKLVIPVLEEDDSAATPAITITTPSTPTITTPTTPTITTPTTPTITTRVVPPSVTIPGSSGKNPRPALRFVGSPNFNRRPQGEISAIVMHATANGNLERVIDWFNKSDAQVSAHYTIGKDGRIVQHVRNEHRAWHAGVSEWKGRKDLNSWAIGIEMVNWNNGEDPYPEAQHQAAVKLVSYLCDRYGIKPELIVAHYDVSPNRKTDPKGYDMDRLRAEVAARLAAD